MDLTDNFYLPNFHKTEISHDSDSENEKEDYN